MIHKSSCSVHNALCLSICVASLVILVITQTIDPTSPYEKLCVSGSLISTTIDGKYEFLYWNSAMNASIYHNIEKNQYLYPFLDSSNTHQYIISADPNNTDTWSSICIIADSSPDYIFNPSDCFKNWISKVKKNNRSDENMRLINCNDICMSGHGKHGKPELDGKYVWWHFDLTMGASAYYCAENDQYLMPRIESNNYYWFIVGDVLESASNYDNFTRCWMARNLPSDYVFDLEDCINWQDKIGDSYFDFFTAIEIHKCRNSSLNLTEAMVYTEQMCISGSILSSVNGIYEYFGWNSNNNASIYYNSNTNYYLYPWFYDETKTYLISNNYSDNISVASCDNTEDCFQDWMTNINGQIVPDVELRLVNCNDICLSGNVRLTLNGVYKWDHFNRTRNSSVYQHHNVYLYGWVFTNNIREWRIGVEYTTPFGLSTCMIGYRVNGYTFNLNDCIVWSSSIDNQWTKDDMVIYECINPPTIAPSSSPTLPTSRPTLIPSQLPTNIQSINPTDHEQSVPTHDPSSTYQIVTVQPTANPSLKPTRSPFNTNNIIITTDNGINNTFIAFNISNANISCGGSISSVKITDSALYKGQWIEHSINNNNYYEFIDLTDPFIVPISVQITRSDSNNQELEIIQGKNVIFSMEGAVEFNFGKNLCRNVSVLEPNTSIWHEYTLYFVILIVFGICLLILFVLLIIRNRKRKSKDEGNYISNALCVVIGIGIYEDEDLINDTDIDGYLKDLPVERDMEHLAQLFNLLNYKMIPNITDQFQITWTEQEIINYFRNEIGKELFDDDKQLKYDGLFVILSCHGVENKIITSDYKTIEKNVLHRIISIEYPETRE
eukprot:122318_1